MAKSGTKYSLATNFCALFCAPACPPVRASFLGLVLALFFTLFFAACASKTPTQTQILPQEPPRFKLVLIKSKNIKFYDFGVLSVQESVQKSNEKGGGENGEKSGGGEGGENNEKVENGESRESRENPAPKNPSANPALREITLELFKLGKSIGRFVIRKSEICFNDDCAPKWPASRAFFGSVGYGDLFEEILLGKDIFDGRGRAWQGAGVLVQRFFYGGEEIYYERSQSRVYFRNLTSGVIVSLEEYER